MVETAAVHHFAFQRVHLQAQHGFEERLVVLLRPRLPWRQQILIVGEPGAPVHVGRRELQARSCGNLDRLFVRRLPRRPEPQRRDIEVSLRKRIHGVDHAARVRALQHNLPPPREDGVRFARSGRFLDHDRGSGIGARDHGRFPAQHPFQVALQIAHRAAHGIRRGVGKIDRHSGLETHCVGCRGLAGEHNGRPSHNQK